MEYSDEGKLSCDVRFASFSTTGENRNVLMSAAAAALRTSAHNTRDPTMDVLEREAGQVLSHSLLPAVLFHTFPKSVLELNVLVLQDDGAVLAAACAAATTAIAAAGVQCADLVIACEVAKVNGVLVVDPTAREEGAATGGLVLAVMPSLNEVTQLFQYGELTQEDIRSAIELCFDGCATVSQVVARTLRATVAKQA